MNSDLINLYSGAQNGGELPYFVGKQYGSGWFKTLGRFAIPILKRLGGFAMKTAEDVVVNDKPFLPSLKNNAMDVVNEALPAVGSFFNKSVKDPIHKTKGSGRTSINKRGKMRKYIF